MSWSTWKWILGISAVVALFALGVWYLGYGALAPLTLVGTKRGVQTLRNLQIQANRDFKLAKLRSLQLRRSEELTAVELLDLDRKIEMTSRDVDTAEAALQASEEQVKSDLSDRERAARFAYLVAERRRRRTARTRPPRT